MNSRRNQRWRSTKGHGRSKKTRSSLITSKSMAKAAGAPSLGLPVRKTIRTHIHVYTHTFSPSPMGLFHREMVYGQISLCDSTRACFRRMYMYSVLC